MENYLYKCIACSMAKFNTYDGGEVWYTNCFGCNNFEFHYKIMLEANKFECFSDDEIIEEENDKEEG